MAETDGENNRLFAEVAALVDRLLLPFDTMLILHGVETDLVAATAGTEPGTPEFTLAVERHVFSVWRDELDDPGRMVTALAVLEVAGVWIRGLVTALARGVLQKKPDTDPASLDPSDMNIDIEPYGMAWIDSLGPLVARLLIALDAISHPAAPLWTDLHRSEDMRRDILAARDTNMSYSDVWPKLLRSVRMCHSVLGKHGTDRFLTGKHLVLEGARFRWRIGRGAGFLRHTADIDAHGIPYDLALMGKDGEAMASCCVYFDRTPVLDQVAAIALHVQNEDTETLLLSSANFSHVTESACRLLRELPFNKTDQYALSRGPLSNGFADNDTPVFRELVFVMEDVVRRRVGLTPALWDFLKDGPIGLLRLEAEDAAFGTNMILSARVQASVAFREDGFPWPTCHPLRPMDRPDDAAAAPRLSA